MEEIEQKLNRLKKLMLNIDESNESIIKFNNTSLAEFLTFIRIQPEYENADKIYDKILIESKIDNDKINHVQKNLLKNYICYFSDIVKLI